jgi:hypothetical protein
MTLAVKCKEPLENGTGQVLKGVNVELSGGGGPMTWQQKDKTNQKGS